MFVGHLFRRRLNMLVVHRRHLLPVGSGIDAARPIEAGAVDHGRIMNHRIVDVRVVDDGRVYVHDRRVIGEMSTLPTAAEEAHSTVAVAVVDPTVEADMGTPVPSMPGIKAAGKAPVAGSPEKPGLGSKHPGSR